MITVYFILQTRSIASQEFACHVPYKKSHSL